MSSDSSAATLQAGGAGHLESAEKKEPYNLKSFTQRGYLSEVTERERVSWTNNNQRTLSTQNQFDKKY